MRPGPSRVTRPTPCPYCGRANDRAFEADDADHLPKPGDVSVCFRCAGLGFFTEEGVRLPTPAEREELLADPAVVEAVGTILAYWGEHQ